MKARYISRYSTPNPLLYLLTFIDSYSSAFIIPGVLCRTCKYETETHDSLGLVLEALSTQKKCFNCYRNPWKELALIAQQLLNEQTNNKLSRRDNTPTPQDPNNRRIFSNRDKTGSKGSFGGARGNISGAFGGRGRGRGVANSGGQFGGFVTGFGGGGGSSAFGGRGNSSGFRDRGNSSFGNRGTPWST